MVTMVGFTGKTTWDAQKYKEACGIPDRRCPHCGKYVSDPVEHPVEDAISLERNTAPQDENGIRTTEEFYPSTVKPRSYGT